MTITRVRLTLALAIIVALGSRPPAWSGDKVEGEMMKHFGGTYRADCKSPTSPSVEVHEATLVFVDGKKRIVVANGPDGHGVDMFGRLPPEHYQQTLEGHRPDGEHLYVIVYDEGKGKGPYVQLEADAALEKEIGERQLGLTYRRCDPTTR